MHVGSRPRLQVYRQLLLPPVSPLRSPLCLLLVASHTFEVGLPVQEQPDLPWCSRRKDSRTRLLYTFHTALKLIKWQEPNLFWLWVQMYTTTCITAGCVYMRFTYVRMPVGVHILHVSSLTWRKEKSQYQRHFSQDDTLSTYAFSKGFWCTSKWF